MSIKNLVEMIKHNGLLTSMAQLEKLYRIAIENEEKLAESEARCTALAAELSSVEAIHNEAVFITDDRYEQCPPEVQKIIRSLAVMQIPAYQAFLAEVRAQGVEMAAKSEQFSTWVQQGLRSFAIGVRQGDEQ
ncbi:TPA: hypothetical protein ACKE3K_001706 [Enterobacter hormaechei]|uniref:hypothetical protein n=1 Tax=Enterobacter hormaechei TaxID=158836 RepID=UPI000F45BD55|nr:hypothetical protein [Enterobacter hormaechei]